MPKGDGKGSHKTAPETRAFIAMQHHLYRTIDMSELTFHPLNPTTEAMLLIVDTMLEGEVCDVCEEPITDCNVTRHTRWPNEN